VGAAGTIGARRTRGAAPAPAPVAIRTAAATRSDLPVYLDAIGTATPLATVSITSQVTGRVFDVHYREGQRVRRGEPLVDIDPRPFAALLLQAQGTLERDLHVLDQARMDRDRFRAAWARRAMTWSIHVGRSRCPRGSSWKVAPVRCSRSHSQSLEVASERRHLPEYSGDPSAHGAVDCRSIFGRR
jgi:hypothetical protein